MADLDSIRDHLEQALTALDELKRTSAAGVVPVFANPVGWLDSNGDARAPGERDE